MGTDKNLAQVIIDSYPHSDTLCLLDRDKESFSALLNRVNEDAEGNGTGDTLFDFIVREISDVIVNPHAPNVIDLENIEEALTRGVKQLRAVRDQFRKYLEQNSASSYYWTED